MKPGLNKVELTIVVLLRFFGIGGLFAIPAILLPYEWMNTIHDHLGLGTMPDTPIVSYLARSLSMFYAAFGAFTLYASFGIRRKRSLIKLWGFVVTCMGVTMLGIDLASGMPTSWTLTEGPPTIAVGVAMLWLQRSIARSSGHSELLPGE